MVVAAAVAAEAVAAVTELHAYRDQVAGCTRCALAVGRTQVVFGSGDPAADLMLVGEAPPSFGQTAAGGGCCGGSCGCGH